MCEHVWMKVHERCILGGTFAVGWECERCGKRVANAELTPAGLNGSVGSKHKLLGGRGASQVYDKATRELTYHD